MEKASWLVVAILVLIGALVLSEQTLSQPYRECIGIDQQASADSAAKENPSAIGVRIVQNMRCTSAFISAHEPQFTALGTLLIAAFTATLWWSTNGLWEETKRGGALAREAFETEQRAWLALKVEGVWQVLKRGDNHASITYLPIIRNVGRVPGFETFISSELMRDVPDPMLNFQIFIEQSERSYLAGKRDHAGVVFPTTSTREDARIPVHEYRGTPQKAVDSAYLLFVCIFYRDNVAGKIRHTASLYRLKTVSGDFTSVNITFGAPIEKIDFGSVGFNSAT